MKKRMKVLIILGVVVVSSLGVYGLSSFIVDKSYDSYLEVSKEKSDKEKKQKKVEIKDAEEPKEDKQEGTTEPSGRGDGFSMKYENSDNPTDVPDAVYDKRDVTDERQKQYLGDTYARYSEVLNEVGSNVVEYCSDVPEKVYKQDSNIKLYNVDINSDMDLGNINQYSMVTFKNSLTVLGMYEDKYLVCAYNYPYNITNDLVCIDYSSTQFSTDFTKGYDYGSVISLSVVPDCALIKDICGFKVLFTKG